MRKPLIETYPQCKLKLCFIIFTIVHFKAYFWAQKVFPTRTDVTFMIQYKNTVFKPSSEPNMSTYTAQFPTDSINVSKLKVNKGS